ncbi:helix-turn-helix domain-containing protein [Pannus brasiliensis CCIBt3594]|uniref:Helix-turn-helix domain-containing protein n=1 Tax=Pannus brasiliensis CCIBt3594 TaxID=1427578 RepID=A0AAW9QTR5_9CHRO
MTIRSRRQQPFIWLDLALDDFDLGVDAFRVYVHLCRRAGKDGNAFPSYASIGEHCFKADSPNVKPESLRRRAMRAIQELIEKGLIERESRSGKGGADTTNSYWINDLKDLISASAGDYKSPGGVTDNHRGGDCKSPGGVTVNHRGGDCKSPPYIEVDPLQTDPSEVDPDKHPPTPQRGDESEPSINVEVISENPGSFAGDRPPTTGRESIDPPVPIQNPGEGKSSAALAPVDPFFGNRRSALSYQKQQALAESLVGSPFESIESQDEFYSQLWNYIRATSPKLDPGQVTGIAKAALKRIMEGAPDAEDRRVLTLWESGNLGRFQGMKYDAIAQRRSDTKDRLQQTAARYFAEKEVENA